MNTGETPALRKILAENPSVGADLKPAPTLANTNRPYHIWFKSAAVNTAPYL